MTDDKWDDVISTNLRGPFLFSLARFRTMMGQRYGRIINVSSVSGLMEIQVRRTTRHQSWSVGFTATVAKEMAKRSVTVNAIAPGFIESEMTAALGPALADEVKNMFQLGAWPW